MPSRSPPTTPYSDVDYPHPIYYGPLSKSQPSIVTIPDLPTHLDKEVQTTQVEKPLQPTLQQTVTVQTLPNPPMTLQQRDPPDLPTLLRLRDILQKKNLYIPMIVHCNLHSPILNLYKSYHSTMELEDHLQLKRIMIHTLYQLDALPFLLALERAPKEHPHCHLT